MRRLFPEGVITPADVWAYWTKHPGRTLLWVGVGGLIGRAIFLAFH